MADLRRYGALPDGEIGVWLAFRRMCGTLLFSHGFACVFWYRVNRVIYLRGWHRCAKFMHTQRYYKFANDISYLADIGPGLKICHVSDIVIGAHAILGSGCTIFNGVTIGSKRVVDSHIKPTVGSGVYIGTGAKVLGDIIIGDNVTIGALTFCDQNIPTGSTAYGNPLVIKR